MHRPGSLPLRISESGWILIPVTIGNADGITGYTGFFAAGTCGLSDSKTRKLISPFLVSFLYRCLAGGTPGELNRLLMLLKLLIPAVIFLAGCGAGAGNGVVDQKKDLNQSMMDLRIHQENLGDHIRQQKLEDASWLLEGMDSILLLLADRFTEHRRLDTSFAYYYKREMQKPIRGIREAIRRNDTAAARRHYRLLVDNCNDCHIDNEVEKEVWY